MEQFQMSINTLSVAIRDTLTGMRPYPGIKFYPEEDF